MGDGGGSSAVLVDAQFSTARVLKPFVGFEDVYEGLSGNIPIAIPGKLAAEAGKPGYDPNLIAGVPVPFGSKLVLWIPTLVGGIQFPFGYSYQLIWRLRNLNDFRTSSKNGSRAAYHFPKQSLGENGQYVIPSAKKIILYEGLPSVSFGKQSNTQGVTEKMSFNNSIPLPPKTSTGVDAALQQGVGLPNTIADNKNATFNSVQLDAEGDEFILLVTKTDQGSWDFLSGNNDGAFSSFYGTGSGKILPDLGIYLFSGSNP